VAIKLPYWNGPAHQKQPSPHSPFNHQLKTNNPSLAPSSCCPGWCLQMSSAKTPQCTAWLSSLLKITWKHDTSLTDLLKCSGKASPLKWATNSSRSQRWKLALKVWETSATETAFTNLTQAGLGSIQSHMGNIWSHLVLRVVNMMLINYRTGGKKIENKQSYGGK